MTKEEMTTLLNIAGVEPRIVDAMTQAYEMGYDHGAKVGDQMCDCLIEAAAICREYDAGHDPETTQFWASYNQLRAIA